jgi:FSR family fosmidomycin resistance protein-like MFS transporter
MTTGGLSIPRGRVLPLTVPAVAGSARLTIAQYGLTHALVDAATAGLVLSTRGVSDAALFSLVLLYNTVAFAPQFLLGALVDRHCDPRRAAALGCALAALGIPAALVDPLLGAGVAGLGNALFHVGGGSLVLRASPGRAAGPGIFVAPGGIGLFVGMAMGKTGTYPPALMAALLLACCGTSLLAAAPPQLEEPPRRTPRPDSPAATLLLLLLVVAVRALAGMTAVFPWRNGFVMGAALVLAATLGKALGGVAADRWGWRRISVGSLVLAAPLMTFFGDAAALGLAGSLLFQATTAVTLAAVALLLPERPAFAFGLPCLALWIGALPSFTTRKDLLGSDLFLFAAILASAALLHLGLGLLPRPAIARAGDVACELQHRRCA